METAPLRSFATWARTELITQVSARITAVLAPASPERTENPRAIRALETDIAKAGGDAKGKDAVADKVAYTWFNRIIALRFMDANGYTNGGVVSPAAGQTVGQPEVLADAKRGTFDPDVVNAKIAKDVTGLLDGTRSSTDPQGEAYTLLLAEYSRHWNKSMPFMFEREGDYTELLIPSNLLADESILTRAVSTMTSAVCEDVEIIGWLYQFYISERKDEVFAGFKKKKKAGTAEIPAATQLFSPHWIVRFLVENSVGRLWMLNHPESRLADQMDYYIAPVDEEADFLKLAGPEQLTVIDPACGSGHMLTYAFDLLYAIYEEEGYSPSEIPSLILTHNLYGTEIDPRAGTLAAFALTMKARAKQRTFLGKHVEPNVCVIEPVTFTQDELDILVTNRGNRAADARFWNQFTSADTFGSLIQPSHDQLQELHQDHVALSTDEDLLVSNIRDRGKRVLMQARYLSSTYCVAVTNPPYMIQRHYGAELSAFIKATYATEASDIFAPFIVRARQLVGESGLVAMITKQTWMFGSSFESLRSSINTDSPIATLAHLGTAAFDSITGEVVNTAAFILDLRMSTRTRGVFIDVRVGPDEDSKRDLLVRSTRDPRHQHLVSASEFARIPGGPVAYWASPKAVKVWQQRSLLSSSAKLKSGISTGDNGCFERFWYELPISHISESGSTKPLGTSRWTPAWSGGEFRRWYGNTTVVMDWQDRGARIKSHRGSAVRNEEFQGRPGITYTKIGGATFAARFAPAGWVFDDAGRMIFENSASDRIRMLAFLNSSTAQLILDLLTPGLNYTSTEIGLLPWDEESSSRESITKLGEELVECATIDWADVETSREFSSPSWLNGASSDCSLKDSYGIWASRQRQVSNRQREMESKNNRWFAELYGLEEEVAIDVEPSKVSLFRNVEFRYGAGKTAEQYSALERRDVASEIVSYAIGCIFGRYSLDRPGLILADQDSTLEEYMAKVTSSRLLPDDDNVLPIVDGDWFEDDIVMRFRQFLRSAFGEEHLEVNLRFIEESLGVKCLRDYFITRGGKSKFYEDHVKRYKKRPIYWMFSSPKGSFNALIYMHRYSSSTVSTVLNDYLREYEAKLEASLHNLEREANGDSTPRQQAAAAKEAERLRKILVELSEYEHEVMYPLASEQVAIDLDDGVKANYPKFGSALKKIQGL